MKKKKKNMMVSLFLVNTLHLTLCVLIYLLRRMALNVAGALAGVFFLCAEIIIWLIAGFLYGIGADSGHKQNALRYAFFAVLPITLITAVSMFIGFLNGETASGWAGFFFFGAALNFYMRPGVLLALILPHSAYLVFGINIILLFFISMTGASAGLSMNQKRIRRRKKRNRATDSKEGVQRIPAQTIAQTDEPKKGHGVQKPLETGKTGQALAETEDEIIETLPDMTPQPRQTEADTQEELIEEIEDVPQLTIPVAMVRQRLREENEPEKPQNEHKAEEDETPPEQFSIFDLMADGDEEREDE